MKSFYKSNFLQLIQIFQVQTLLTEGEVRYTFLDLHIIIYIFIWTILYILGKKKSDLT